MLAWCYTGCPDISGTSILKGNLKNSTPELLKFLDEQGIIHGIRTKKINCSQIAALLREKYPDITFVAAKVQGTRLLLTISEET